MTQTNTAKSLIPFSHREVGFCFLRGKGFFIEILQELRDISEYVEFLLHINCE